MLGLLEQNMTPTLDKALLCSSRAGSDLGRKSDRFEELYKLQAARRPAIQIATLSFLY